MPRPGFRLILKTAWVYRGLACQENASQVNLEIRLRETCDARAHFLLDLSNECRRLQQRLPWRWKAVIRTAALKMMMRSPTMDARDCAKPLSLMCCLSPASAVRFLVAEFPIQFDLSPAALKAFAAHFGLRQHAFMRVFQKVIGCIDGILIKVCAFVSR